MHVFSSALISGVTGGRGEIGRESRREVLVVAVGFHSTTPERFNPFVKNPFNG